MPDPYIRIGGAAAGPAVVCLHANASTSAQWRGLMDALAPTHRVLAPDAYGAGKSPDWHSDRHIALRDEVEFLAPVFDQAGTSFSLVGHSYGAAVALVAALAHPERIRAMALYEPTLFALVDAQPSRRNGTEGILNAVAAAVDALEAGDRDTAAGHFIDFWMGAGSWATIPAERRQAIADSVRNLRRWGHALFSEPTPADAFASLNMPILYMLGESSPEAAHAVARVLLPRLPNVTVVRFPGLGHMAPVTHPGIINAEIARFLAETDRPP